MWRNKLEARINNVSALGDGLFLGYCTIHKQYYKDYKHTNGEIRCPPCDAIWLKAGGFN